jgi:transposase
LKREVVRLKLENGWSYGQLRERFGIKSDAQIGDWVKKVHSGESSEDLSHFVELLFGFFEYQQSYLTEPFK